MTHPRRIIREAFAAVVSGLPTTGARVFVQKRRPLTDAELPALRISTPSDSDADPHTIHEDVMPLMRRVTVTCDVVAKASSGVEDIVDQACEEVEAAIESDGLLGGAVLSLEYRSFDSADDTEGDQEVMVGTLTFEAVHKPA